ncbi:hypothetical protein BLNAU_5510 [Blattamonas nauphoetae]|uniref:Uncharacterized protein n=1 Tax=Blattamonas nauphoetae TaxID=2049346 RepID=A0ABQ9Y6U6_9EUKA|nr:hypothetical protein BLNAU_5510 [Blattamonas nauphoetae]
MGGYFEMYSGYDTEESCVTNLTTSGNGALVNAKDTNFNLGSPILDCHATNGGALFLQGCQVTTHKGGAVCIDQQNCLHRHVYLGLKQIVNCSADMGGGLFIYSEESIYTWSGGSFADSHPNMAELISTLCTNLTSLSGRSVDDEGRSHHVEVEGYPQLSCNLPPPTMELDEDDNQYAPPTMPGPDLSFNSLSFYLQYIHTQAETGEYVPIPIYLKSTLNFFGTSTVTKQAIVLIMSKKEESPVEKVEVKHGQGSIDTAVSFVEVADEGSMEFSTTKFEWTIAISLCRLVSPSASSSITRCVFTIPLLINAAFVECDSGKLSITSSSFTMQAPLTDNIHPIVYCFSSSSHTSNGKNEFEIEMSDVSFNNMTVQSSAAAVVVIHDADRIRLDRVRFVNVLNSEGEDGMRIVVHGRNLVKVIEYVKDSDFPQRNTGFNDLYESLDKDEVTGSLFHSPTLLLYLTFYTAPTILVHSIGRDGVWCGDAIFPCVSLDEADLHLSNSPLCTISVVDVSELKGEVDLTQDKTDIMSKGGDRSRVEVWGSGRLVNEAVSLAHSLRIDSLAFSLASGRSVALLESRSGMLSVTSCSFSSSSPLLSKLLEVTGGSVELGKIDLSSLSFTDSLLSFSNFANVNVSSLAHRECSAGTLMSFEGNGKTESRVEVRDCTFIDKQDREIEEDRSLLKIRDPIRKLNDEEDTSIDNSYDLVNTESSKVIHTMLQYLNIKFFRFILSQANDRGKVES